MVADTPPGHLDELGHVACLQVPAALQPTKVACGGASGFVAIAGTSCTDACVHQIAILQLASPGELVLLRLPSTDSTHEIVCLEWSPYVADAMLLVAYRHGLVLVYSMSSPARCDPPCLVQHFVPKLSREQSYLSPALSSCTCIPPTSGQVLMPVHCHSRNELNGNAYRAVGLLLPQRRRNYYPTPTSVRTAFPARQPGICTCS